MTENYAHHRAEVLFLTNMERHIGNKDGNKELVDYHILRSPKGIVKNLTDFLDNLANTIQHCEGCGGISPELHLSFKNREYCFVCYEIKEGDKVLAMTDYKQLERYCKAVNEKK
jgi:recombinational DNA repair protein RecR